MRKRARGTFGTNLKLLRERQGISQAALAERAAIPHHTVSRIERQRKVPSLDEALALCAALGARIEHLAPAEARLAVEHQWALDELLSLARKLPTEELRKVVEQVGAMLLRRKR